MMTPRNENMEQVDEEEGELNPEQNQPDLNENEQM